MDYMFMTRPFWLELSISQKVVKDKFIEYFGTKRLEITSRKDASEYLLSITGKIQEKMVSQLKSESACYLVKDLYKILDEVFHFYQRQKDARKKLIELNIQEDSILDVFEENRNKFLYYYHLVKGSLNSEAVKDKIVVIDDPVSSMDSGALFIVSALVREMIEVCYNNTDYRSHKVDGDYIKQIFILTHNVYFHKEITHHQAKRYHSVSFYMIRKIENISSVKLCVRQSQRVPTEQENYNPIQNSYAALWDEYKELKTANTVKNVIRHILEYYFIQICGYEGNDLHKIVLEQNKLLFVDEVEGQKPNYDRYNLASSMLTYMNDGPAVISDGFNYIDDGSDVEQCKKVFELIFTAMHQEQHYKMMMGIED